MAYYTYTASRVSGDGNAVFPDEIIIDDEEEVVIHRKPKLIGSKETKKRFGAIDSIEVDKGVLFADIIIETNGGQITVANGFSRSDAKKIQKLLTNK